MPAKTNSNSADSAPIYTDRRHRANSSGGKGFSIFLIVLLILAVGGTSWLYFDQINKNSLLRQEMIDLKQSTAIIREALQITDETITDSNQERRQKVETMQKELNKLWIQVNKKNKVALEQLTTASQANQQALTDYKTTLEALVAGQQQNFSAVEESVNQLAEKLLVQEAAIEALGENTGLADKVAKNSKLLATVNNARTALNSRVAKLQQEISLLKNKMLTLENSQPIPTHDLERPVQ